MGLTPVEIPAPTPGKAEMGMGVGVEIEIDECKAGIVMGVVAENANDDVGAGGIGGTAG